MTAWPRRENEPAKPLTEDRKRLVQSYMDAEEETARREAIEERERQFYVREQARRPAAQGATLHAVAPAESGQAGEETVPQSIALTEAVLPDETAEESARLFADAEERARREAGEAAARQIAETQERARRWADQEVRRRVAVAVEEAREEVRRELSEEAGRRAPLAEEQARREAAGEGAEQIAAAAGGGGG